MEEHLFFFNVLTLYPAFLPVLKTIMCSLWFSVVVSLGSPKGAPKELPSVPTLEGIRAVPAVGKMAHIAPALSVSS